MSWEGYLSYDGIEVINTARTEAYAAAAGASWFRAVYQSTVLPAMLDTAGGYITPALDDAPWYDPAVPASNDFFGLYPLSIDGLDDSARSSEPIASTTKGGTPGRLRQNMKTVVTSGILVGATEEAVAYGMAWLSRVLTGGICPPGRVDNGQGADLLFLSARPDEGKIAAPTYAGLDGDFWAVDPTDPDVVILSEGTGQVDTGTGGGDEVLLLNPLTGMTVSGGINAPQVAFLRGLRRLRRFRVNSGPSATGKAVLSCGGTVWQVQFTGVAGDPTLYSVERPLLAGYMSPSVTDPWVPGVTKGAADATATGYQDIACGEDAWEPLYDPLCAALIAPPAPPSVPLGCFEAPDSWSRRKVTIPSANVPRWGEAVPIVTVSSQVEVRNVRLRFYADADGTFDPASAPCDFVGDAVISYLPAGAKIILDGTLETVVVETVTGHRRRADTLVFSSDGTPFEWPTFACGYGYILTVDLEPGAPLPVVDLSLVTKVV